MMSGYTIQLDLRGLTAFERVLPQRVNAMVMAVALEGEAKAKLLMNTSPAGRQYGRHTASQPGYPPNVDTGILRNSIQAVPTGGFSAAVVARAPYAVHLEFGTSKMAARPFFAPTVIHLQQKAPAIARAILMAGI